MRCDLQKDNDMPTIPMDVLKLEDEKLKSVGLSRQKVCFVWPTKSAVLENLSLVMRFLGCKISFNQQWVKPAFLTHAMLPYLHRQFQRSVSSHILLASVKAIHVLFLAIPGVLLIRSSQGIWFHIKLIERIVVGSLQCQDRWYSMHNAVPSWVYQRLIDQWITGQIAVKLAVYCDQLRDSINQDKMKEVKSYMIPCSKIWVFRLIFELVLGSPCGASVSLFTLQCLCIFLEAAAWREI